MRWGRTILVATMVAAPLWVAASQPVQAAPLTGVEFIAFPTQTYDSINFGPTLPAGRVDFGTFGLPAATQVLLQVTVVGSDTSTGSLMFHNCALQPNQLTDIVLPIRQGSDVITTQVYVEQTSSGVCMTTTVDARRVVLTLEGSVVPGGGGAAYVDLPFQHVTTVVGPGDPQIDLSAFGVPADASGVAVWLDSVSTTAGYAIVHPCGSPAPVPAVIWNANEPSTGLIAGVSSGGNKPCITISDGASVDVSIDGYYKVGATATATSPPQVRWSQESPPGFVGTTPTRLFDTRSGGIPIPAGQSYRLDLSPFVPVDTSSVVMNVTATEPGADGFVTAYPCEGAQPETSSLNFVAGQTVPNSVTVDAGPSLAVCFFASVSTHLLADLAGYYVFGGGDGFAPSPPVRMLDTRNIVGGPIGPAKVPGHGVFDFDVSPFIAPDATAVVFNLTATDVAAPGFVTAYQCGFPPPTASNLNVLPGQTVPNLVTVALPSTFKHVCFFTTANINLIADLAGWYSPSSTSGFIAIPPTRWVDTRDDNSPFLPAGLVTQIPFEPSFPSATAMVFNATATQVISAGYLTAFPCDSAIPNASNVNYVAGQTVPNMVIASVNSTGSVCIFNSERTHWIVDVSGFFTDAPQFFPFPPAGTDID